MDSASYENTGNKNDLKSFLDTNGKILAIVINRISILFFIMSVITGFIYLLGSNQGFMDQTQFFLLRAVTVLGILLLISSVFGLVINLFIFVIVKKRRYLFGSFLYIFFIVSGGAVASGAYFIIFFASGNM